MTAGTTTTHDRAELLQTPEELRAIHQDDAYRDADAADAAYNLAQARAAYARYADADELQQLAELDAGVCDQCDRTHYLRFRYGSFELCRACSISRINAIHQLTRPDRDYGRLQKPTDLHEWIDVAAGHIGARALDHVLTDWGIDDDTRIGILERHADLVRRLADHANQIDRWLASLEPAGEGRCARCRRTVHDRYHVDGRALCRIDALQQMPRTPDRKEAA